MNQQQAYMDPHAPTSASASGYTYGHPQALQPASQQYHPASYGQHANPYTMAPIAQGYAVPTPMTQAMVPQSMPLPAVPPAAHPSSAAQPYPARDAPFDQTGQVAPPGIKPRVTATLWEDEGSLCFQVEARGVCVARREDNHMINGTKLLNVAGMTRGRRDGILKSEKTRHVVKIGPMHLKGVWIPFDRALDFANKEKITEALYPLFVHNIGALLYHPQGPPGRSNMSNSPMAVRRPDQQQQQSQQQQNQNQQSQQQQDYMRTPTGTQPPPLPHHHTMSNPGSMAQPTHSIAPHPASGRPSLDRAHTFPTQPASASGLMGMGNTGSSYEYGAGQPTVMSAVSTPPQSASQAMAYSNSQQPYDQSRSVYSTPASYAQYGSAQQYAPTQGVKNELSGQARAGAENDTTDGKALDDYSSHAEAEAEGGYTHSASLGYGNNTYEHRADKIIGAVHPDSAHISPDMTHSPQQNGSGRATPRTTNNNNSYIGYNTPQRGVGLPSSNLYNVMSNDGRSQHGTEAYTSQGYQAPQPHYPSMNGVSSGKRARDDDDDHFARSVNSPGSGMKRQRTDNGNMANRPISQPQSVKPVR